jgi:transposase
MERLPHSKYTKELRLEAVRLVTEGGLSVQEASVRLSMPKSTLESWLRAFKSGKLERIGSSQRPLTEMEAELARVKRELALVRMERDILKKAAAYFAKESLHGTRRCPLRIPSGRPRPWE